MKPHHTPEFLDRLHDLIAREARCEEANPTLEYVDCVMNDILSLFDEVFDAGIAYASMPPATAEGSHGRGREKNLQKP
jgi:hypothetical protein